MALNTYRNEHLAGKRESRLAESQSLCFILFKHTCAETGIENVDRTSMDLTGIHLALHFAHDQDATSNNHGARDALSISKTCPVPCGQWNSAAVPIITWIIADFIWLDHKTWIQKRYILTLEGCFNVLAISCCTITVYDWDECRSTESFYLDMLNQERPASIKRLVLRAFQI